MTKEFLIGVTLGVIGMAGMVYRYLSKHRQITEDDYEQKLIRDYLQVIENNEYTISMEQRLKSLEDTLILLRTEMASMTKNESKNRISIRIDQGSPRMQCHQMHCHPCTPPACWPYPPPVSQPVYSGPTIPPPPVHPVPMAQPPLVQPEPMIPPVPVHSVPMPPPPPIHSGPMIPPPPMHMPPPPPSPMMTTSIPAFRSNSQNKVEGSSLLTGPDKKATITYGRIPITTELLKSVVLKPPGERILKK